MFVSGGVCDLGYGRAPRREIWGHIPGIVLGITAREAGAVLTLSGRRLDRKSVV